MDGRAGASTGSDAPDELGVRPRGRLQPDAAPRGLVLDRLRAQAAHPRPAELRRHPGHVPRRALLTDATARARRHLHCLGAAALHRSACCPLQGT